MQVPGDPAPLQIGGLDRAPYEELPFLLGGAHLSSETQSQRDLNERERDERDGEDREERPPELFGAGGHRVTRDEGLEEQDLAARRGHGKGDLQEGSEVGEPTTGFLLVTLTRRRTPRAEGLAFGRAQLDGGSDRVGLVGVQHPAVGVLDRHPCDRASDDATAHQLIDREEAGRVASQDPLGEAWFHDPMSGNQSDALGLSDRLLGSEPAHHHHAGEPHESEDHQARHRECEHGPRNRGLSTSHATRLWRPREFGGHDACEP